MYWAVQPALYSAAVATSQVISTKIPLTVVATNVVRTSALGAVCIALLASGHGPDLSGTPAWVLALSAASGAIMFCATVAYISMCRELGVVTTSVYTTAFSFFFTAVAGAAMGERVTARTAAGMAAMVAGLALQ